MQIHTFSPVTDAVKSSLPAWNRRSTQPAKARDADRQKNEHIYKQQRVEEANTDQAIQGMYVREAKTEAAIREGMAKAAQSVQLYNANGAVRFLGDFGKGHLIHTIG